MDNYHELKDQYSKLLNRNKQLESEIHKLQTILTENNIEFSTQYLEVSKLQKNATQHTSEVANLSLEGKVNLFQSLFKGRNDVFARRWYSTSTDKSGYQPVCQREWDRQYCDKKKYKCTECPNRILEPLSYEYIFKHLAGKDKFGRDVVGIYAILADNNCNFLCTDFDDKNSEHGYKNDVQAFTRVCKDWKIFYLIERSRSGKGAHVWILFDSPLPAYKARKLGSAILTEAMNRNCQISFKSYDRFFPNQDSLPEGGFGNLVALPLQGQARRNGNSIFVNDNFEPYVNQWAYLQSIKKNNESSVNLLLANHNVIDDYGGLSKSNESKPWDLPSLEYISPDEYPNSLRLVKSNKLFILKKGVSTRVLNYFRRIASFRNPEFFSRQAMRLPIFSIPRIISCVETSDDYLILPRGCEDAVRKFCIENNISLKVEDKTQSGIPISAIFNGTLRDEQTKALNCMLSFDNGVLSATTAFGKTVMAAALIAHKSINTLILVHSKALLEQWRKQLEQFLVINNVYEDNIECHGLKNKRTPIGTLYSGKNSLHGIIDIALMQSCIKAGEVQPFVKDYGMVIVDECHHVSAVNFEEILKNVYSHFVYGLTATPIRKDGHQPIIFMQCGSIRYFVDAKSQIANQTFDRILIPRFTSSRLITFDEQSYSKIIHDLSEDELRNKQIVTDVVEALKNNRTPIILTTLTSHVKTLSGLLSSHCKNVISLIGAESSKIKQSVLETLYSIDSTESLVVVATGKYVGEGFDYPRLDTLFLALPVSWKGIIAQYAGRLHRDYKGKTDVRIYDYIDIRIPICNSMYRKRMKGYSSIGYANNNPKNAYSNIHDCIFDGKNYYVPFNKDVSIARKNLILSCPRLKISPNSSIVHLIQTTILRGVNVVLFTQEHNPFTEMLGNMGIDLIEKSDLKLNCAIIDQTILWYGNANFLGYASDEYNIMRINNHDAIIQIMDMLYDNGINL